MLKAIFNWFGHTNPAPQSQAPAVQPEAAPYKVEAPAQVAPTAAPEPVAPAPVAEAVPQRAKNNQGKFVADNPATPENEAWKGGKAPAAIKAAPKKAAVKKPAAPAKPAAKKPRAPKKTN